MTQFVRRLLIAMAVLAGPVFAAPSAVSAEALPPQVIDANAEFLAYAPPVADPGTVCVVDTGVDLTTDVAPNVVGRLSIFGGPVDDTGGAGIAKHGTYVAGIIGSRLDGQGSVGIWPQARIVSVRVFPDARSGTGVGSYVQALNACHHFGASVVNLSLSDLESASGAELEFLANRVADLRDNWSVNVVAAAGNSGDEVGYPGRFPAAFTVSGTDASGGFCSMSARGHEVDIAALGCGVVVSLPNSGVGAGAGTSYAAPVVSGALAGLRAYTGLGAAAAESVLLQSARVGVAGRILDVAAAFRAAGRADIANTPPPGGPVITPPAAAARPSRSAANVLTALGVRRPRWRTRRYAGEILTMAVSGVPDFGRAVFIVDGRRYVRASGVLRLRRKRAPRIVSVRIDVPGVGRTTAIHAVRADFAAPTARRRKAAKVT